MSLSKTVAKLREIYHTNMTDVVNVLNQLHIIKDEKADEYNKRHVMTLVEDVWPRLYGQEAVDNLFKESTKNEEELA